MRGAGGVGEGGVGEGNKGRVPVTQRGKRGGRATRVWALRPRAPGSAGSESRPWNPRQRDEEVLEQVAGIGLVAREIQQEREQRRRMLPAEGFQS